MQEVGAAENVCVWMEEVQIESRGIAQKRLEKEQGEL